MFAFQCLSLSRNIQTLHIRVRGNELATNNKTSLIDFFFKEIGKCGGIRMRAHQSTPSVEKCYHISSEIGGKSSEGYFS